MATVPNESASVDQVVLWLDACHIPSAGFTTNSVTGADLRHLEESELVSDLGLTNIQARKFKRLVSNPATPNSQIQETAPPQVAPMQQQQAVPPMNAPYYGMPPPPYYGMPPPNPTCLTPMMPMMPMIHNNNNVNTNTVANNIVINTDSPGENSEQGGVALRVKVVDTDGGWEGALLKIFELVDVKLLLTLDRTDSLEALRGKIISKIRARSFTAQKIFNCIEDEELGVFPFIADYEDGSCCCNEGKFSKPIPELGAVAQVAVSEGVYGVFGIFVRSLKLPDGFELDDVNSLVSFFGASEKQIDLELLAEIDTVTNRSPETMIPPQSVKMYNSLRHANVPSRYTRL